MKYGLTICFLIVAGFFIFNLSLSAPSDTSCDPRIDLQYGAEVNVENTPFYNKCSKTVIGKSDDNCYYDIQFKCPEGASFQKRFNHSEISVK